ncbi:erythromycin esterase family protein [Deinococcus radiopugnans]|uniref:erythromycin esterase family protein n=1 Tax=Deinococcus radiopugnans TaxID=57497 RepID=UPI0036173100
MKRILSPTIALALLGSALAVTPQEKITWLQQHAIPVRTLDIQDDEFSDLTPLRSALSGVRVILLGEQSHGDGTTFQAKARLIRYLHEELGFNVLAFESSYVDLNRDQELIKTGSRLSDVLRNSLQAVWSESQQMTPLLNYLDEQAKTKQPLRVAGIDLLPTNPRRLPEHGAELTRRVEVTLASMPNVLQDAKAFLATIGNLGRSPLEAMRKPMDQQRQIIAGADELTAMLKAGKRSDRMLAQEIRNWRTYLEFMWSLPTDFSEENFPLPSP